MNNDVAMHNVRRRPCAPSHRVRVTLAAKRRIIMHRKKQTRRADLCMSTSWEVGGRTRTHVRIHQSPRGPIGTVHGQHPGTIMQVPMHFPPTDPDPSMDNGIRQPIASADSKPCPGSSRGTETLTYIDGLPWQEHE